MYTDAETGFVDLRARYYDPATGQFLSRDPLVALTRSPHAYVYDNPLNASDPLGLGCLVHKSNGGCLGASVVHEVQQPVAMFATLASHASAVAQTVAAACAAGVITGECAPLAEAVAVSLGAASTLATAEVTTYLCLTNGSSSSGCVAGGAATVVSSVSLGVSAGMGDGFRDIALKAILSDANAAVNTATMKSRLFPSLSDNAVCP